MFSQRGRAIERGNSWGRRVFTSASNSPFFSSRPLRLVAVSGAILTGVSLSLFHYTFSTADAETKNETGEGGGGEGEREIKKGSKRRVVVLGSGWGAVSLLKDMKPCEGVEVVCISPTNYFLMTPLLPSATVGE